MCALGWLVSWDPYFTHATFKGLGILEETLRCRAQLHAAICSPIDDRTEFCLNFELDASAFDFAYVRTINNVDKEEIRDQLGHFFVRLNASQARLPRTKNITRTFWKRRGLHWLLYPRRFG
jgi:hypothetical protein